MNNSDDNNCQTLPPLPGLQTAETVGARLKQIRESHGLSQRELAKRAGITNSNISMIEQGQVSPSVQSLARILAAVPLSLAEFFSPPGSGAPRFFFRSQLGERGKMNEKAVRYETLGGEGAISLRMIEIPADVASDAFSTAEAEHYGWVIDGRIQFLHDGQSQSLQTHEAFVVPRGLYYRLKNPLSVMARLIIVSPAPSAASTANE